MFQLLKRLAANVGPATTGRIRLFIDAADDLPKTKDENGTLVVLGNGIVGITQVGAGVLTKTYRISLQDGTFYDFTVADGDGIVGIAKTATNVLVDTYTISYESGATTTFDVNNGRSIVDFVPPANPGQPDTIDTYTITYNDNSTSQFVVRNGRDGLDGQGNTAENAPSELTDDTNVIGDRVDFYARENHQHAHGNRAGGTLHAAATQQANGFMAAGDKAKLDGIESGAQVNVLEQVAQGTHGIQVTTNGKTATVSGQSELYTAQGLVPVTAKIKQFIGVVAADANGVFTVNWSAAGFVNPPFSVMATALSVNTGTVPNRVWATMISGFTNTQGQGYALRGADLGLGGATVRTAPNTVVHVIAWGQ